MTLIAKETSSFTPAPQGTHLARCIQVVDLGIQSGLYGEKHQVWIQWELPNTPMDNGKPFVYGRRYTMSLNRKSNLRSDLEGWRGRAFTKEERGGFDLKNVLGMPCQLIIKHQQKDDGTVRAEISAVLPMPKDLDLPPAANDLLYYDLDSGDPVTLGKLPEWIQEAISAAVPPEKPRVEKAAEGDDFADPLPF